MQEKNNARPPQSSLLLRLLGGGYLIYLAWDITRGKFGLDWITAAAAVFAIVGGALFVTSAVTLAKSDYFYDKPSGDPQENTEETE